MMELVFPQLLACCAHTKSDYWERLFENLAYGKSPPQCYIETHFLCKVKAFRYDLTTPMSDEKRHQEIVSLLVANGSPTPERALVWDAQMIHETPTRWNMLGKKDNKVDHLYRYIHRTTKKHRLDARQQDELRRIVMSMFLCGTLNGDDVVLTDGVITDITSITFNGVGDPSCVAVYKTEVPGKQATPSRTLTSDWKRYVSGYERSSRRYLN